MNPSTRLIWCLLATASVSGVGLGCSAISDRPELGRVTGVVSLDDKPLPGVTVIFTPEQGRCSMALTDAQGHYELSYLWDTKGAKVGWHNVSVSTSQADDDSRTQNPQVRERIPARYNAKTILTTEVRAGDNSIDIMLDSK